MTEQASVMNEAATRWQEVADKCEAEATRLMAHANAARTQTARNRYYGMASRKWAEAERALQKVGDEMLNGLD